MAADAQRKYNLKAVHEFLVDSYSIDELKFLIAYDDRFDDLLNEFGPNDSIALRVNKTIEYCQRRRLFDEFMALVEEDRPGRVGELEAEFFTRVEPPQHAFGTLQHHPGLADHVYDFTEVIQPATHGFVGREFVFGAVESFLNLCPCGYLRIEMEAGLGKTAIAAELTKCYNAVAHFFNASMGITRPVQCLNDLSAKLIFDYDLAHDDLPTNAGEDSAFLSTLLREATQKLAVGKPLFVVIDALDEADPTPAGHNWLHLPSHLPAGAYIVLTHRPGDYPLTTDASTPVEDLSIAWDDPHQQTDIETHLQKQALERAEIRQVLEKAEPPISQDDFVSALRTASEGNFMYLDYVLNDIANLEPGFDPLCLDDLPRGLVGYYNQFWAQMTLVRDEEGWSQWNSFYRPTIALLGVAGEPVPATWFAVHAGHEPDEIRERVLLRWQRFLRSRGREGQELWSIIHQSFRDFLMSKLSNLKSDHARVAKYYLASLEHWREHDNYALRHLSTHLATAGESQELGRLVEDPTWYRAQCTHDPTRHNYVSDVTKAFNCAKGRGLDGLPLVLACGLLRGTIATRSYELSQEEITQMIEHRQVDSILKWAGMLPDGDSFRLDLLQLAGEVAELAGRRGRAVHTLRQAVREVSHPLPHEELERLESLALGLMRLRDKEGVDLALSIGEMRWQYAASMDSIVRDTLHRLWMISQQVRCEGDDSKTEFDVPFDEYPAIKRLSSKTYSRGLPGHLLWAAEQSAMAWARWAEVLNACGKLERAHEAFAQAKSVANMMSYDLYSDQPSTARVLGRLAEVAEGLSQSRAETEQLLDEAIAAAERPFVFRRQISAQVVLINLSVKLGYVDRATQLLRSFRNLWRRERPHLVERVIWLAELAPSSEVLREPLVELALKIEDERLRQAVQNIWQVYSGNAQQALALLDALDNAERFFENFDRANEALILRFFSAMIPVLEAESANSRLLRRTLKVSRRNISDVLSWLAWLEATLSTVPTDDRTATILFRDLRSMHLEATPDEQPRLASHLAPPLTHLPMLDPDWALSLVYQALPQERPHHRRHALKAIEKLAPFVLALAGTETAVESWDHIQAVERLFR